MTTLYTEHDKLSDVPPPNPGWVTLGLAKNGQVNDYGVSRKMTLGERFLGKISKFYHVNMTQQSEVLTVSALSDTGRLEFPITVEIDYRVSDPRSLISNGGTVEKNLLAPMRREIFPRAKTIAAADFAVLENELKQMLDPAMGGPITYDMFEVTAISIDVQPPAGLKIATGEMEDVADVKLRIAAALARGDTAEANNLKQAALYMRNDQFDDLDDYNLKLDKLTEVLRKRGNIEEEAGGPVAENLLRGVDNKIEKLGGAAPELTDKTEDNAKKKPSQTKDTDDLGDVD